MGHARARDETLKQIVEGVELHHSIYPQVLTRCTQLSRLTTQKDTRRNVRSLFQTVPRMTSKILICALRKTSFADRAAWHGMAWQSIRGTGAGGGERTVENYVKMFWIVKPDGRTEKSHCTATGLKQAVTGKGRWQLYISPPPWPFTLPSDD